jgi:hypothetical protein
MATKKHARRRIFVDPKVQGALVLRVAFYWVVSLITITLMLLCWRILTGPPQMFSTHAGFMWAQYGPALIASFVIVPLVMIDIIRMSNRLVGPILRLRRSMRALATGEEVRPIHFREGDFWKEFADEFNSVVDRVQRAPLAVEPDTTGASNPTEEESSELAHSAT